MATSTACRCVGAVPALQAGDCFVVPFPGPPLRVSPGFNMTGFQPADQSGPKARDVTAWAGASITGILKNHDSPLNVHGADTELAVTLASKVED
jgi:hypothetical protein